MISIIIPCYNSGTFLKEAIESCYQSKIQDFEIIIVNDGSTDQFTLDLLEGNWPQNVKILYQPNKGAAAARNFGVSRSSGDFLLFLDSDNLIRQDYLTKASKVLQIHSSVGVVYSIPQFFGEDESQEASRFEVKDFSIDSLLAGNFVDMCSMVRKNVFLEVGGFDENPEIFFGEDWDLWIRMAQSGWEFHFLNEVLFDYRIRKGSLMDQVDFEKRERTLQYLGTKHGFIIHQRYRQYYRVMEKIRKNPFSFFFRILYNKYFFGKPLI